MEKRKSLNQMGTSIKLFMGALILCFFSQVAFAGNDLADSKVLPDNGKIKGTIIEATTGEALIGANVFVEGTSVGAAADINGNYEITIPASLATGQEVNVIASFVGYKKQIKAIVVSGNVIELNFDLEEDIFESETVVVTGIASKTSKAVAEVAVARVSVENLSTKQNFQGVSQLFTGKIAGVNVLQGSGNVGSGWRFYVRGGGGLNGNGQPLIFVDGIRVDNADLSGYGTGGSSTSLLANLNVDDISNIEVLKGPAAAAEYGTNASNGVVLITTKNGKIVGGSGKQYTVDYKFNYGLNTQRLVYDEDLYTQANKLNEVLDTPGYIREHSLSISGGSAALRYYTSFQNRFESGLIPFQNNMDRTTFKANISAYPSENLTVQVNTTYAHSNLRRPQNDNSIFGWIFNTLIYNPPYSRLDSTSIASIRNTIELDQFQGSGKVTWKPIQKLEITGGMGLDYNVTNQERLYPIGFGYNAYKNGERGLYKRNSYSVSYDFNAKYATQIMDKLNYTGIVGAQMFDRSGNWLQNRVRTFAHPNIMNIDAGEDLKFKDDNRWNTRQAGLFFTNNFSFENTYFLTLAIRKDYASAIGFEAPSIYYPRASFAVRLDKFDFLPSEISLFKVRAAYGESGQMPNTDDGIPITWSATAGANGVGSTIGSIGNIEIEPERISEIELGFDAEFLKIFSLEFTYYNQKASNSIIQTSFAPSVGFGGATYPFNVGSVEGWGTETLLQINPIRSADYDLSMNFIWNYQYNEVTSLGPETDQLFPGSRGMNVLKPGFRKYQFFDEVTEGATFNPDGTFDGYIRGSEKVDLGNPIPDHSGSITLNFRFLKDFELFASAEWGLNNKIWSYTIRRMQTTNVYIPVNKMKAQLGITTMEGVTPLTPGTQEYIDKANEYATWYNKDYGNFVFDADYFIIRDVSLSYNFTNIMNEYLPNDYLNNVTLGFAVRNVAKFTKYPLDNEVNYSGGRGGNYSNDFATLPSPRTYNFWVRFGF